MFLAFVFLIAPHFNDILKTSESEKGGRGARPTTPLSRAVCFLNVAMTTSSSSSREDLRELVRSRVTSEGIQERIKECVSQVERGGGYEREESLLKLLEEKGLVDEVLAGLKVGKDRNVATKGETTETKDRTVPSKS